MYAIVRSGNKQYRVKEGDILFLDKLGKGEGEKIDLEVLAVHDGESFKLSKGSVQAEVLEEGRARKIIIFKKRRRKDSKRKRGFRRSYTKVRITAISI